ncbi:MAG: hypothetical protein ACKVX9_00470, partial [Blastocatellia bacterium]
DHRRLDDIRIIFHAVALLGSFACGGADNETTVMVRISRDVNNRRGSGMDPITKLLQWLCEQNSIGGSQKRIDRRESGKKQNVGVGNAHG